MRAIVRDRYGPPALMRVAKVDKPEVTPDAALVRVHASSVNAWDWHMMRGKPYIARAEEGLRQPKTAVLGLDVAGVVEAVGSNVTHLKPGDRAFGSRTGAFAEYISGRHMAPMPSNLTFEQAASVPTAGQTALQALRDKGGLQPGQRVLINGAGGGVGTFAVQIAKAFDADVTAVTSTKNLALVESLGADRAMDYTREDFTRGRDRYDLIVDAGGNRRVGAMRRVLASDGTLVMVAPGAGQWIGPLARVIGVVILGRFARQTFRPFVATVSRDHLLALKELIEAGKVTPVIERIYRFEEIPDAVRHVEEGHPSGKVVVTI